MPGYLATLVIHRASGLAVVGFANAYTVAGGDLSGLATDLLATVLDREPAAPSPWRPRHDPPPAELAALCGRWWWMGQEHEAGWDAVAGELVITPLTVPDQPWRFRPEWDGPASGQWRGVAGENDGELLVVRYDGDRVTGFEVASLVFTRHPDDPGPAG